MEGARAAKYLNITYKLKKNYYTPKVVPVEFNYFYKKQSLFLKFTWYF